MELAVKAMTERLVEDCGGWLPLTMRAWRKYTRRKLEKKSCLPAGVRPLILTRAGRTSGPTAPRRPPPGCTLAGSC